MRTLEAIGVAESASKEEAWDELLAIVSHELRDDMMSKGET